MVAAPEAPLSPGRLRWAVFAGLAALLVGLGLGRFGYTPLVPALIREGWADPAQAAYAGAANLAGYLLGALFAGRLSRHSAEKWWVRGALAACTAAFAACALPLGFAWLSLWRGIAGVAGAVLMVLTPHSILAAAPVRLRGRVGGILFLGVGSGIVLSALLIPWLLRGGLSFTWIGLAALSALLSALAWWGYPDAAPAAEPRPAPVAPAAERPIAAAPWTPAVLLVVAAYSLAAAAYAPHTVLWVDFIARGLNSGMDAGAAYWLLFGLGATFGPVLLGMLGDRFGFTAVFRVCLLCNAAAVALPLASTARWSLALSSLVVGGFISGCTSLSSTRLSGLLPPERRKIVWGVMTTGFAVVFAAAGYGVSWVFGRTGNYGLTFGLGAVCALIAWGIDASAFRKKGAAA